MFSKHMVIGLVLGRWFDGVCLMYNCSYLLSWCVVVVVMVVMGMYEVGE